MMTLNTATLDRGEPFTLLRTMPITVALLGGPVIDVVYRMAELPEATIGGLSLAQGLRGLLCVTMVVVMPKSFLSGAVRIRAVLPLGLLVLYTVSTSVLQPQPFENLVFAVRIIFLLCVFLSVYEFARAELIGRRWIDCIGWSILVLLGLSQVIGYIVGYRATVYRSEYALVGLTGHPKLGAVGVIAIFPFFLLRHPLRKTDILALVLCALSAFATLRRSAIVSLLLAATVVGALHLSPRSRRLGQSKQAILVLVLILISLISVSIATPLGNDVLSRALDLDVWHGGTGSGRTALWQTALEHLIQRSFGDNILGEGLGTIRATMLDEFGRAIGSHNDWLDIWFSLGFVGLLFFAWWHVEMLRLAVMLCRRQVSWGVSVIGAFVIVAFFALATGGIFAPGFAPLFAVLALVTAESHIGEVRPVI